MDGSAKKDSRKWKAALGLLVVSTVMAVGVLVPALVKLLTTGEAELTASYVGMVESTLSWWGMACAGFFGLYAGSNVAQKIGTKDVFLADGKKVKE